MSHSGISQARLEEVASIQTGPFGSQLHASDYVEEGIPCIMPTNIGRNLDIVLDNIAMVSLSDAQRLNKYTVKEGDIVYSRRGDISKCAYISTPQHGWLCGTGCLRVRFNDEAIFPKYGAYFLSQDEVKTFLMNRAVGATMPNLNTSILGEILIEFPPLPTQRRIAAILSAFDDKIELNRQMNQTLEEMAQAVFREMCVPKETILPDGWKIDTLGKVMQLQRGFDLPKSQREPGNVPVIAASGENGFHNEYKVKAPGVTTGRSGVLGNVFYVQEDFWPLNTSLFVKQFLIGGPIFSYFTLNRIDLEKYNGGSAVPTLNRNHVHKLKVPIPPVDVIRDFELLTKPIFQKSFINEKEIGFLRTTRDALLPKLMSGEIEV